MEKLAIMYIVMVSAFIYANDYHKKIIKFLSNSKKQYIKYMESITEYKIQNNRTYRFASLGVGL